MQAIIFCRTEAKGKHTFYVKTREDTYYLFQQDYRKTNNEYFKNGVSITDINNYGGVHSTSVKKRSINSLCIYVTLKKNMVSPFMKKPNSSKKK